jgi:hypothetical protein
MPMPARHLWLQIQKQTQGRSEDEQLRVLRGHLGNLHDPFHIKPQGEASVVFTGAPNAGKSALVGALTEAATLVADYPFSTICHMYTHRDKRLKLLALLVSMLTLLPLPIGAQPAADETYSNLRILPTDISPDSLQLVMSNFASALGVRCTFCHVRKRGKQFFAADDKPQKVVAREMMQMTRDINAVLQPARGQEGTDVGCVTCHHGTVVPRTLQLEVMQVLESDGIDAATEHYRQLRAQYYGQAAYDFGENSLIDIAGNLSRNNDDYAAIEVLRLNAEFFPESSFTQIQLAGALHRIGAGQEAEMRLREALRIKPDSQYAKSQLQKLLGLDTEE